MLESIFGILRENITPVKGVIKQFLICLSAISVVIVFMTYKFLDTIFNNQIADYKLRLELRDDQIRAYKDKLDGASPEEAKVRIEKLEKEVQNLRPRKLSERQLSAISGILRKSAESIEILYYVSAIDGQSYCGYFAESFRGAGWDVNGPTRIIVSPKSKTGLVVGIAGREKISPAQKIVIDALQAAGIEYDLAGDESWFSDKASIIVTIKNG